MNSKNTKRKTSAARRAGSEVSSDTRTRIIERSIALFNRRGIQNVSIVSLASDLRISPGNVTYHFKRKRDLILETLWVLQEHLRVALKRPVGMHTPKDGAEWLLGVFRTFWDFRFFFNGLAYLLASDPQLRKEYREFRNWVIATTVADLQYLQTRGYLLVPKPPNSFRLYAENLWSQWLNWLRMSHIDNPRAATPDNPMLFDGLLHLWSLAQPWMPDAFAGELLRVFEELVRTGADAVPQAAPARRVKRAASVGASDS
ncbi:MAG TPA: TetR/AcrR family transcriptional regulator [Steroidobacteraceae bacterium]|nr:TetR/AcrR family transcriptional regulator [Steroidobacteraceae bacterium]